MGDSQGGVGVLERKQQQVRLLSSKELSRDELDEGDAAWSMTLKSSPIYGHFVAAFLSQGVDGCLKSWDTKIGV